VDRPLLITKNGTSVVPHQNWRGMFAQGTNPAGQLPVPDIDWPGYHTTPWHGATRVVENWFGSLSTGMRDASGQMYMRNRYYDAASGQFTQPDPIGLAGGLNSYGFAAGDPVSYADPYGLAADTIPEPLREKLGNVCGNQEGAVPDCDQVNIVTSGVRHALVMKLSGGRAVTLGNTIYSPRALNPNSRADVALAAHELVHAGEYQMLAAEGRGLQYYQHGLMGRIREHLGQKPYDWRRVGRPFAEENGNAFEARGQVVEDCFLGVAAACAASPYRPTGLQPVP
jgi:RHS repeat-associated protein